MAKDHRLDLGRYITNPFNEQGRIRKNLDFDELFRAKPERGGYPWNPSRFTEKDLTNRVMTRKRQLNPTLNFVQNSPFFDDNSEVNSDYELFEGLGRFNRPVEYNFNEGRPVTSQRPEEQPDFNPTWVEAYKLSPTLDPSKSVKNPMPRLRNPDPNGFLFSMAQQQAEDQASGTTSVAQLLTNPQNNKKKIKEEEEKEGEVVIKEAGEEPKKMTET